MIQVSNQASVCHEWACAYKMEAKQQRPDGGDEQDVSKVRRQVLEP
jgi:hypothetical protein